MQQFFPVICVGATVFYSVEKIKDQDIGLDSIPSFQTWSGFFQFCGVVVFSMEGVGVALPIENNMKHPNLFPVALISGKYLHSLLLSKSYNNIKYFVTKCK